MGPELAGGDHQQAGAYAVSAMEKRTFWNTPLHRRIIEPFLVCFVQLVINGKYWDMVMAFRLLFCYMLPLYFIFGTQYRCSSYFFRQKNRPGAFYAWPVFLLQH